MDQTVIIHSDKQSSNQAYEFASIFMRQIVELAEIRNPSLDKNSLADHIDKLTSEVKPVYVEYPWRRLVLEMVPEKEFNELKTNRNRELITIEEQQLLYGSSVSIAGMSVGSSLLYGLVGSGFAKNITIADDDALETTNLNRVQATVLDIGLQKVTIAAQRALEMNPFLKIHEIRRVTEDSISSFIQPTVTKIVFEEIDDFAMKLRIRVYAKKHGVPLVMLTNIGDSVMLDVERYDTDKSTVPFNGLVDNETIERIREDHVDTALMKELSVKLVDRDLIPERAIQSLQNIGVSLVGRPQLYGTVAVDGGIAPYVMRKILVENDLPSGRYTLSIPEVQYGN